MQTQQSGVSPSSEPLDALSRSGEMGELIRSIDWEHTRLGPISGWPTSLKTMVGVILGSRFPMLVWWGPDLIHLYNDAYRPVLGDKHPASMGAPAREVWAEIWHIVGPMAEDVLAGGPSTWSEHLFLPMNRKGYVEETYFTLSYAPVPDDHGKVGGVLVTVQETTEQVQDDRQLRMLRDLAARAADAESATEACQTAARIFAGNDADLPFTLLYLVDEDGATARLVGTSGLDGYEGPGKPAAIDLRPDSTSESVWPLAEACSWGREIVVHQLAKRVDRLPGGRWGTSPDRAIVLPLTRAGHPRPYGLLVAGVSPRRALDERYLGLFRLTADHIVIAVANARAYEEERKRAEALAELDQAKTAFFGNVSHEFRTPLTLILGPVEDALANGSMVLSGEALHAVHRNALRLLKLVNTLLDFSRIEAGRVQALYEPTDLGALTTELASGFRAAVERAGLELVVNAEPGDEPAYVDRGAWEKIVLNLISNALKFTFEGNIAVTLRRTDAHFVLEVKDTGIGVPAQEIPHLFERFHRVEGARARTYEGSGIGLALVHELVRSHKGTVSVESQLGRGTTFRVCIPRGSLHLPKERIGTPRNQPHPGTSVSAYLEEVLRWVSDQEAMAESIAEPPSAESTARSGTATARILLADDNADMRSYLTKLLSERWTVRAVGDGVAALAAAREHTPDLVLTDVMMPRMDGFQLLRALRSNAATQHVPVIMLTARAGEESTVEGLSVGADDYLVKPFSAKELVARVRTHLELARSRRAAESERNRLQAVLRQAPAAINFLRGPEHVFELAHPLTVDRFGGRDLVGKPLVSVVPTGAAHPFYQATRRVFTTGEPERGVETLVPYASKTGKIEEGYWNYAILPVRSASGEIEGVMTFDVEMTEQVFARKKNEALMEELRLADRRKDEFLAMLAHELRNPLSPLQAALYLIRRRLPASPVDRQLDVIERQATALARIVDDLLDVSRITRGKIELRKEHVDVSKAVARALEATSEFIELRRHEVAFTHPGRSVIVMADPVRLDQIIVNLLMNAAKYTDTGGKIWITIRQTGAFAELSVRDNGIGLDPELRGRIFDVFQQGGRDLSRAQGGLGIGLTIVRSLVELHGGSVEVFSDGVGKGSDFVVRMPLAPVSEAFRPEEPPVETERVPGQRRRVLVVDDNRDAVETLAEFVGDLGYDVRTAVDGPSALRIAEEWHPDLVFLDIGLPGMDGYEVARELRRQGPGLPTLVALTGYGQERDRDRSQDAGFTHHLVKPPQARALETILADLG